MLYVKENNIQFFEWKFYQISFYYKVSLNILFSDTRSGSYCQQTSHAEYLAAYDMRRFKFLSETARIWAHYTGKKQWTLIKTGRITWPLSLKPIWSSLCRLSRGPKLYLSYPTPRKFIIQLRNWNNRFNRVLQLFREYSDHWHTTAQILSRINKKQKIFSRFYQFHVRSRTAHEKIHAWFCPTKHHSLSAILDSSKHRTFILSYPCIFIRLHCEKIDPAAWSKLTIICMSILKRVLYQLVSMIT